MNKYTFIKIAMIAITLGTLALITMSSCRTNKLCNRPTKKQINKAMSYSSWEFVLPKTQH